MKQAFFVILMWLWIFIWVAAGIMNLQGCASMLPMKFDKACKYAWGKPFPGISIGCWCEKPLGKESLKFERVHKSRCGR